jgi:hypothetical protein
MRVTSALWVAAFLRSENSGGASACVMRRGAEEAGAIFVIHDHLDGAYTLYGPAPQSEAAGLEGGGRLFERLLDHGDRETLLRQMEKQQRFDPDCWIVETERRGDAPSDLIVLA